LQPYQEVLTDKNVRPPEAEALS